MEDCPQFLFSDMILTTQIYIDDVIIGYQNISSILYH